MSVEPVVPRPAATVLLLRDHPEPPPGRTPLQVFLQRRVAGMAFAGGMTVFPGGGVDPADAGAVPWTGPGSTWWGDRLSCPPEQAGALVVAAVRETFEECGVLLAEHESGAALGDLGAPRAELVAHRSGLAAVLAGLGAVLRSDLLAPWARWVTPQENPRRYDTVFFAARVPAGQTADDRTTEALEAAWWHPADALDGWQRGELELMAPTFRTLEEIGVHRDTAAVLAAARDRTVRPVVPRVRRDGDRIVVMLPGDPGFETAAGHLRPADLR